MWTMCSWPSTSPDRPRPAVPTGPFLEIHEAPIPGRGRPGRLADRVPITVEPGIYLPGRGGVRIEDTLVVRSGASASARDLLTTTTIATGRELLAL